MSMSPRPLAVPGGFEWAWPWTMPVPGREAPMRGRAAPVGGRAPNATPSGSLGFGFVSGCLTPWGTLTAPVWGRVACALTPVGP
eukprot:CAMPEP_0197604704 /NCGR_PEP_ID=MMETSP1326-20131121/41708_1 /TAXON_ID=1155430 /ORGANISM="Genus nov. species nov., Strain RCC2288" /LENGTH=83 /DNA_ID=CAMNT_0043172405 /DNA_START=16 /DNA_END=264 /DNA_ORIENTATION=+